MTCPAAAETTAPSAPTRSSGTRTTLGWRSCVIRANVSSAARIAAGGIGETIGILATLAISLYSDASDTAGQERHSFGEVLSLLLLRQAKHGNCEEVSRSPLSK
jgi:hypothetical protein